MIDRGDAYKDSSIDENENMILAFNDNFLKLFLLLATELEPIYLQALDEQMTVSKIHIFTQKKVPNIIANSIDWLCVRLRFDHIALLSEHHQEAQPGVQPAVDQFS